MQRRFPGRGARHVTSHIANCEKTQRLTVPDSPTTEGASGASSGWNFGPSTHLGGRHSCTVALDFQALREWYPGLLLRVYSLLGGGCSSFYSYRMYW